MAIQKVEYYLNGQVYEIPLDSGRTYRKKINAPGKKSWGEKDHKYESQLKITDVAGNVTTIGKDDPIFGDKMMLRVKEGAAPIITITSPAQGAYLGSNSVQVEFTVTDAESGANANSISVKIDSGAEIKEGITKIPIENGYKCSYTATVQNGAHTVKINASDNDDNAAIEKTASFVVDTIAPTLNITSPPEALVTNEKQITVSGKASPDCRVTIKVGNTDQGAVTLDGTGQFNKQISLSPGGNVIMITATSLAGKVTTVTREVTYDPNAPVVISIDITPNPIGAGEEITITVEATDE